MLAQALLLLAPALLPLQDDPAAAPTAEQTPPGVVKLLKEAEAGLYSAEREGLQSISFVVPFRPSSIG